MFFLKYIPFSLHWIVTNSIGKNIKTMLDLGCGDGRFTKDISYGENWKITGVDLFNASLDKARKYGIYYKIIKGDISNISSAVGNTRYDAVIAIQVIEHLKKEVGESILRDWEKMATKRIIVSTPVGFIKYDRVERKVIEKNSLQKHLCGWQPAEFKTRGYRVYGQGVKFIYGEKGLVRILPSPFWPILILLSYLLSPIVFFFPRMATYMIAVKDIRK